jgi:hypothetical protein
VAWGLNIIAAKQRSRLIGQPSSNMIGRVALQAHKMAGKISRNSSTHAGKVAIVTASTEGYEPKSII